MADTPRIELAALLNDAAALVGDRPLTFGAATAIYVAAGIWIDSQIWSLGAQFVTLGAITLLSGLLQYLVLRRALGPPVPGGRLAALLAPVTAVATYLVVWIVASIGYVLLVLPGCYLAGRLSAAVGVSVAERTGLFASIAQSWRRTRQSWLPLMLGQALLLVPLFGFIGLGVIVWVVDQESLLSDETSLEFALLSNLVIGAITLAGWAIAGAAYRLTAPKAGAIEDVFA
ncbi:hypothetical protein OK349_10710 [Sphingomonas sp. BT-65]|uniref:hypothetical protein n=1 Tax=Sphingomonas sp. BT-65 TaxID=2989821 RepID=UPI0022361A37|nr:hypothetical protein [Sphingomonas sp. BT-65]MCW4462177.1 hypothetical protein [Sphingomonas sp. BT-65]